MIDFDASDICDHDWESWVYFYDKFRKERYDDGMRRIENLIIETLPAFDDNYYETYNQYYYEKDEKDK